MQEFAQRAWRDIKQRKNLELYIILLAIIAVFLADTIGVNVFDSINSITLAALGVLLYSLIDTRHATEKSEQQLDHLNQSMTALVHAKPMFFSQT